MHFESDRPGEEENAEFDDEVEAALASLGAFVTPVTDAASRVQDVAQRAKDEAAVRQAREGGKEEESRDLRTRLAAMTIPERLITAMTGDGADRALLIFDPNAMISRTVLQNPQLSEKEVEVFVKSPNLSQEILRIISTNREWMANYSIKRSLVFNPKAPADITLKFVKHMMFGDLKLIAKSKNVPSNVVKVAQKMVADKAKANP